MNKISKIKTKERNNSVSSHGHTKFIHKYTCYKGSVNRNEREKILSIYLNKDEI